MEFHVVEKRERVAGVERLTTYQIVRRRELKEGADEYICVGRVPVHNEQPSVALTEAIRRVRDLKVRCDATTDAIEAAVERIEARKKSEANRHVATDLSAEAIAARL